jgi:biotin synthase-like enzyme
LGVSRPTVGENLGSLAGFDEYYILTSNEDQHYLERMKYKQNKLSVNRIIFFIGIGTNKCNFCELKNTGAKLRG